MVLLLATHIRNHFNVEAKYLSWKSLVVEWHLIPHVAQETFRIWVSWRCISWYIHIPINVSIFTPWKIYHHLLKPQG